MSTTLEQAKELYRKGDLKAALEAYERAAELIPDDPEPCFAMGVIKDKQGEPEAAVAQFEAALKRRPSFGKAYVNLAAVHAEQGRFFEARRTVEKGLELGERTVHKALEELLGQLVAGMCHEAREARARAEAALRAGPGAKAGPAMQANFSRLLSALSALAGEQSQAAELIADETGEPTFLWQGEKRKFSAQLGPAGSILMVDAEAGAIVTQLVLEPDAKWATAKFSGGEPGAAAAGKVGPKP
ncbi:MAG: tetratricopeptide repeat protein [Deltaproteobacteria bacterium]|nr:tetratricopeptide repeat protein [Deltaproteobacteria bacterium]